ncbi:MAG: OmpA family protein [Phycisphaerales bacterium]|nr:OmpA family protein [Phycisphaerales bacterium]
MTKRVSTVLIGGVLLGSVGMTGCVPQDKYDSLLQANRSMVEQLTSVNEERSTLMAQIKSRDAQLTQARSEINRLQSEYALLGGEFETLNANNEALAIRLAQMQPTALPADVEAEMVALAQAHPDLLTFDPDTGMIRLSSDLTFGSGSHELKKGASEVISTVAGILNDGDLANFQVLVVGHTDNVPLARSKTKYGNNVRLSAYRADSVREAMVGAGMAKDRFRIAGDGPFNPIVPNEAKGGTQANRRVEIFLVSRTGNDNAAEAEATMTAEEPTTE